jgi:hypothetical protein
MRIMARHIGRIRTWSYAAGLALVALPAHAITILSTFDNVANQSYPFPGNTITTPEGLGVTMAVGAGSNVGTLNGIGGPTDKTIANGSVVRTSRTIFDLSGLSTSFSVDLTQVGFAGTFNALLVAFDDGNNFVNSSSTPVPSGGTWETATVIGSNIDRVEVSASVSSGAFTIGFNNASWNTNPVEVSPVPEPASSMVLLGAGLAALAAARRREKNHQQTL